MKLTQFEYDLPGSLITKYPAKERDLSRLMVLDRKTQKIEHIKFRDLQEFFGEGDVAIVNDTKVFPARLYGKKEKTGARIEVFLLRELNAKYNLWDVMVDPARKIRVGNKLYFGENDLVAEVVDNTTSRGRTLRFLYEGDYHEFRRTLDKLGETPLPHYLKRRAEAEDVERYQTIFAEHSGAVAAPTAGLHFTRALVKRMELRGVAFCAVTLHVGLGTFRAIEVEDLTKHKMDSEEYNVPLKTAEIVNRAKRNRKNICIVGTTAMRAVESAVGANGFLKPMSGWTNKFIFPPYEFNIATHMVTNFHLPQSPLLMMAAAFAGYDFVMGAYKEAVKKKYRFFTYGDAMLIK